MATTIKFQEIFSRFLMKIEGYDLFDPNISNEMRNEIFNTYIHSATSASYIRRLFNVVWISDPVLYEDENGKYIVDGLLEFSMNHEVEKQADKEFVIEVLAYGMAYAWVEQKVNSSTNLLQLVGTSDEKYYSQQNHLSGLENLRDNIELKQRNLIRDRGFIYNDYLSGNAATASLRG